jgi:TRAP-type transport system periplasmic protein
VQPISIRFGGYQPPASVHNKAADVLGRALMARLGKAVQFNLDGNIVVSGHQAADLLTMIESGVMTMGYFSASYLAAHVPEFALLDLPFTINDRQAAYRILDGPLGQLLADKLSASTGFRLLGWWDNGFRHLTNAIRPIRTPMDCMGLRIRTLYSDVHQRVFKLLGFVPVALDVKELIVAVQSGAIDAQENQLTNIYNFGIHRLTATSAFLVTSSASQSCSAIRPAMPLGRLKCKGCYGVPSTSGAVGMSALLGGIAVRTSRLPNATTPAKNRNTRW